MSEVDFPMHSEGLGRLQSIMDDFTSKVKERYIVDMKIPLVNVRRGMGHDVGTEAVTKNAPIS